MVYRGGYLVLWRTERKECWRAFRRGRTTNLDRWSPAPRGLNRRCRHLLGACWMRPCGQCRARHRTPCSRQTWKKLSGGRRRPSQIACRWGGMRSGILSRAHSRGRRGEHHLLMFGMVRRVIHHRRSGVGDRDLSTGLSSSAPTNGGSASGHYAHYQQASVKESWQDGSILGGTTAYMMMLGSGLVGVPSGREEGVCETVMRQVLCRAKRLVCMCCVGVVWEASCCVEGRYVFCGVCVCVCGFLFFVCMCVRARARVCVLSVCV